MTDKKSEGKKPAETKSAETKPEDSKPAENKSKKKTVAGLRVSAKVDGFRRGGRAWSVAPQDVRADAFTEEQIEQIKAERELSVIDIEIDAAAEPEAT